MLDILLTMISRAPVSSGQSISVNDISKVDIAVANMISSCLSSGSPSVKTWVNPRQWLMKLACVIGTPLGFPVEPDVKMM